MMAEYFLPTVAEVPHVHVHSRRTHWPRRLRGCRAGVQRRGSCCELRSLEALMARQSQVKLTHIVPVSWLTDYVSMLRAAREAKAEVDTTDIDAAIDRRIAAVQAYLDRLEQVQLN